MIPASKMRQRGKLKKAQQEKMQYQTPHAPIQKHRILEGMWYDPEEKVFKGGRSDSDPDNHVYDEKTNHILDTYKNITPSGFWLRLIYSNQVPQFGSPLLVGQVLHFSQGYDLLRQLTTATIQSPFPWNVSAFQYIDLPGKVIVQVNLEKYFLTKPDLSIPIENQTNRLILPSTVPSFNDFNISNSINVSKDDGDTFDTAGGARSIGAGVSSKEAKMSADDTQSAASVYSGGSGAWQRFKNDITFTASRRTVAGSVC